jgi:hypothetical protein
VNRHDGNVRVIVRVIVDVDMIGDGDGDVAP